MGKKSKQSYTAEEQALVAAFREKLKALGVLKFPRDWHLKQLSTARAMLAGDNAPSVEQWVECIEWAFTEPYWRTRIDHLARIEALWPRYCLQNPPGKKAERDRRKRELEILKELYY